MHNIEIIKKICPNVSKNYITCIEHGKKYLDAYGVTKNKKRYAHFFAHCIHETAYLTKEYENLNYSAKALVGTWPSRFKPKGPHDPALYAKDPIKIANLVYGGRMGNDKPNDGWNYRGRGFLNLTGKGMYKTISSLLGSKFGHPVDLVVNPDLVLDPEYAILIVCEYIKSKNILIYADRDDITTTTKLINGGTIGLKDRTTIKNKLLALL